MKHVAHISFGRYSLPIELIIRLSERDRCDFGRKRMTLEVCVSREFLSIQHSNLTCRQIVIVLSVYCDGASSLGVYACRLNGNQKQNVQKRRVLFENDMVKYSDEFYFLETSTPKSRVFPSGYFVVRSSS